MRYVLSLLALQIASVFHLGAQTPAACTPPPVLRAAYETDVKHLALLRILETNGADSARIDIPADRQDSIWRGLAAIFNAENLPQQDSVFDIYCVHHGRATSTLVQGLLVGVDGGVGWLPNWRGGDTTIDDATLDSLLQRYHFRVEEYDANNHVFLFTTDSLINLRPIARLLEDVNGVNFVELNQLAGDGNTITYDYRNGRQYFTFTLGWGDCPAGCTVRYYWSFEVEADCTVNFLDSGLDAQSGGGPLAIPETLKVHCNLSPVNSTGEPGYVFALAFTLAPNPADEQLRLHWAADPPREWLTYTVIDGQGRQLFRGRYRAEEPIGVASLSPGVYWLSLHLKGRLVGSATFVKR